METKSKRKILIRSEWFILPYLFVFCLLTLGNVADNWSLPGLLIFVAQSIVILIELFTAFHVALLLSDVNWSSDESEFVGFLIGVAFVGLAAIPLSFFWGWVLFALAFALLVYHVSASIALYLSREAVMLVAKQEETPKSQVEATQEEIVKEVQQ